MTRPDPRNTAALSAALSRAVDLSALKARADAARTAPAGQQPSASAPAPAAGEHVVDVTEATFQAEVVEGSLQVPVIVALVASWSGQSQQLVSLLLRQGVSSTLPAIAVAAPRMSSSVTAMLTVFPCRTA